MAKKTAHNDYSDELEEVWALFAEDGREALDLVEETLLALESSPTDTGQVAKLFRGLHTFKGNARIMGLSTIESLAHHAEDLVALVRDEGVPLTGAMVNLLLEALDHSRRMLDYVLAHRRDVEPTEVAKMLAQLRAMMTEHADQAVDKRAPSEDIDTGTTETDEGFLPLEVAEAIIDPATDPEYVRIFLEMVEEELDRLHSAVDALASSGRKKTQREKSVQEIKAVVDVLLHATRQMGYDHLTAMLDSIVTAVEERKGKARVARLYKLESALKEELNQVGAWGTDTVEPSGAESTQEPQKDDGVDFHLTDATELFQHWCLSLVRTDLVRLSELADELEHCLRQFWKGGSTQAWDEQLVTEMISLLRAVHHSCILYELAQAAHLTLALEDLYLRAVQGEMAVNETLLNLTRTYAARLSDALATACKGDEANLVGFEDLIGQTEEMLYLYTENRVLQVTSNVLEQLDLSPEFREVMTAENLLQVSRALQKGENFYTVLADLNQNEVMGQAFYEWSRSNTVRLITNVTVYHEDHTLFDFLLTSPEPYQTILKALAKMDPQGQALSLEKHTLQEDASLKEMMSDRATPQPGRQAERTTQIKSTISIEDLADFAENVGELVATRATLHRVVERLTKVDLVETVTRLVRQSGSDWQRAGKELQAFLKSWMDDLSVLSHVEAEMGSTFGQLQETALSLRARPAAEILEPLRHLVQDVARHEGKIVELTLEGTDVGLDHNALNILADPVHRLVWFALVHSIEKPVLRREMGKTAAGHVSVVVTKVADRVTVVIQDDGRGLDHGGSDEETGIDLAAIKAELQSWRGRLNVVSQSGQGTQFSLELPLDMVVVDGMVMRVGGVHYVVPVGTVRRIVELEETRIVHSAANGGQRMLQLEEELVPIQTLTAESDSPEKNLLVVLEKDKQGIALPVDELIGQQQVLIQPLQGCLADVSGVSGCALLGEGDVGMVLDPNQMGALTQDALSVSR
jgi:chemotaxis protein histidine kinase CheA